MRFFVMLFLIQLVAPFGLKAQSDFQKEIGKVILAASTSEDILPTNSELETYILENGILTLRLNLSPEFLNHQLDENIHEELIEYLSGALHQKNIQQINVEARNRHHQWQPLSSFLQVILFQVSYPAQNEDPILARAGDLTRRNVLLEGQAQPTGVLSDKTIWLSAGHGWQFDPRRKTFKTQRHNTHGVVEDFATIESVNYHLLQYLYRAGGNVWTVRERDMNTEEIILDNDNPKIYRETGKWTRSKTNGYAGRSYRYTITKPQVTATAHFTTEIKKPGKYWVSVHYVSGTNRTVDARYRIRHAGGESVVSVNQEVHGDTWVYLGQFYFTKQAEIMLSNESSESGQAIIADAVRLGGGRGNVPDCFYGKSSGEPRYEEAAKYFAAYQGFPHCLNDVVTRPLYAEWELSKGTKTEKQNAIYVSWHSNANGSSGTETYVHSTRARRGSRTLQKFIHGELIKDIRSGWDEGWEDRGRKSADFGELRALRTMPGVLLEMAFHDHAEDAKALLDPRFRNLTARAVYKGIVRYYAKIDRTKPHFLPEPPQSINAFGVSNQTIKLSWAAPNSGGHLGDPAKAYKVYISENGHAFANGIYTQKREYNFKNLIPGQIYYFQVTGINDGGESFPSPVVAVRLPQNSNDLQYLLVDGYDRLDRSLALNVYAAKPSYAPLGNTKRLPLERMNDQSYAVEHAEALAAGGAAFDGVTNDALVDRPFDLKKYDGIAWFLGRESTKNLTLSLAEQNLLARYLDHGGNLLISGSELAYHLDYQQGGRDFFRKYFRSEYAGDNARSQHFEASFLGAKKLNGDFLPLGWNDYPVHSPDYLRPRGSSVVLKYDNGKIGGVGVQKPYGLVYLAIPFESIRGEAKRSTMMRSILGFLHGEGYHEQERLLILKE